MFINLFRIHSGTRNISVQIGFGFGSLNTKILDPFGYLINFGTDLVLLFRIGFGSIFRSGFFAQPYLQVTIYSLYSQTHEIFYELRTFSKDVCWYLLSHNALVLQCFDLKISLDKCNAMDTETNMIGRGFA